SSCYLLDSPEDSLEGIYKRYTDIARLSKFAGGIGVAWHRIRSKNSLIVGTNGLSNGIVPWLKTLDASVAAVNQGGRRKGAACVYLESWHADIDQFLELRDNTGDHARRTHNINLANWIPDLFMERVEKDWQWSLFDPKRVPELIDTFGEEFRSIYEQAEADLGAFVVETDGVAGVDYERLGEVVRQVVPFLDRVIDINYYPTDEAGVSNARWRPVGLGLMGLQDVFFKLGVPFDSPVARDVSRRISEEIYFNALWASTELAEANGAHAAFPETRAANGDLQFDLWGVEPSDTERWEPLRERIKAHGLRNSLMIAIAPTATIASIAGCYECIEPQVSNLFKRETLSGEFMQINRHLVKELQSRGLWDAEMIAEVKKSEGSIQDVDRIPDDLKAIYRTAWEIPMKSLIEMA
ncbi:MAG: ribonucleoside-diphosphate reductase subunit alpha, partial [Acidimicrobiia bacterium]|nr:ribonucleoside-diphosphate reductase subunit alpha [Acidimicrobiia bacterium]